MGVIHGWQRDAPSIKGLVAHGALWGLWPTLIIFFGAKPNIVSILVALAVGADVPLLDNDTAEMNISVTTNRAAEFRSVFRAAVIGPQNKTAWRVG